MKKKIYVFMHQSKHYLKRYSQIWIERKLKVKKRVNYLGKNSLKTVKIILKQKYGKTRKNKMSFFNQKDIKRERVTFCKEILKKQISGKKLFFTNETKIELVSFINDSIIVSE